MTDSAIRMIPIGLLLPHPDNPRKDLGDLTELTESIKANGVMQNLTVVPAPESDTNRTAPMNQIDAPHFRVVIGHRRLAAARKAGLKELPCAVMEMTPEEQIAVMLAENIHRSALTPYEEAMGFQQLQIDFGKSAREISRMSGVGETTVRSRLKLADMDGEKVRKGIRRGATLFDFSELDKVEDERAREKCLDAIGTRNFKNELKSALEEQTFKHNFERWTRLVRSFAAEIPEPEHQMISGEGSVYYTGEASARTRIDYNKTFHRWTKDSVVQVPEDAGTVNYYFTLNDREITLYREHIVDDAAETQRRREQEERDAADARVSRLEAISARHCQLRRDFVKEFGAAKSSLPQIVHDASEVIVRFFLNNPHSRYRDTLCLANDFFDMNLERGDVVEEKERDVEMMRRFREIRASQPEKTLLLTLLWMAEGGGEQSYVKREWNSQARLYEAHYRDNPILDQMYYLLESIGYQISDEEQQMRHGTHPLFDNREQQGTRPG